METRTRQRRLAAAATRAASSVSVWPRPRKPPNSSRTTPRARAGVASTSESPLPRLPYRFIVLFLTASVLALPLCPWFPRLAMLPAASFIAVGLMGLLAGVLYRRDLAVYLLRLVPYTLFFMGFYSLATVLSMLRLTPEWKGRRLKGWRR